MISTSPDATSRLVPAASLGGNEAGYCGRQVMTVCSTIGRNMSQMGRGEMIRRLDEAAQTAAESLANGPLTPMNSTRSPKRW